jgi:microcompartment protein CcmK/EutM
MQLARVIGDVVATRKDDSLVGIKLLILQPLTPERENAGLRSTRASSASSTTGMWKGEVEDFRL